MKAYGYKTNFEDYTELNEITIVCTKKEIDNLIDFLNYVRVRYCNSELEGLYSTHYRDWDKTWMEEESDIIITTDFGEESSED